MKENKIKSFWLPQVDTVTHLLMAELRTVQIDPWVDTTKGNGPFKVFQLEYLQYNHWGWVCSLGFLPSMNSFANDTVFRNSLKKPSHLLVRWNTIRDCLDLAYANLLFSK